MGALHDLGPDAVGADDDGCPGVDAEKSSKTPGR